MVLITALLFCGCKNVIPSLRGDFDEVGDFNDTISISKDFTLERYSFKGNNVDTLALSIYPDSAFFRIRSAEKIKVQFYGRAKPRSHRKRLRDTVNYKADLIESEKENR